MPSWSFFFNASSNATADDGGSSPWTAWIIGLHDLERRLNQKPNAELQEFLAFRRCFRETAFRKVGYVFCPEAGLWLDIFYIRVSSWRDRTSDRCALVTNIFTLAAKQSGMMRL